MADDTGTAEAPSALTHRLFVAAILAGSFLLFLVQPMVARMALPKLGGAPAVWNSAMLVYQALLLGGYAYAHWLGRVPPRMQAMIHLCVLAVAALWLPIGLFAMELPADAQPAIWVPWLFGASIGPLFFAIAAQAPLLQRWYSVSTHGRDPYQLYAASNIGSFGGLLAYPLLVEPNMALNSQRLMWTAGYALVFALIAGCALMLPRKAQGEPHVAHHTPAAGWRTVLHWIVLAFVPSGLMLATTTFLTTDIVAVPMLWVVPLGLYLLSFSVAFSDSRLLAELFGKVTPLALLLFGATLIAGGKDYPYLNAFIGLALLFLVSVALHSRMYAIRPAPDRLTGFYLAMSVGGALGGVFSGLIAPIVFDWTYEYPLLILAAGMLVPQLFLFPFVARLWRGEKEWVRIKALSVALLVSILVLVGLDQHFAAWLGEKQANIAFMAVAVVGLLSIGNRWAYVVALAGAIFLFGGYHAVELSLHGARTRSYFGVYTVSQNDTQRVLAHGTTVHGIQMLGQDSRVPTSYYVTRSGIGQAMLALPELYGPNARIGLVGLGAGTLSCYAKPGQQWRIYEIDPAVVSIARDSGKFSFLSQCLPHPDIVIGDARLRLAEEPSARFDLLALDAFSSDAVPMHLMTAEAFQTYARVLAPKGLLMVHISNRFLALDPVVAAAAQRGGWYAAELSYRPDADRLPDGTIVPRKGVDQGTGSDWIALSRDKGVFDRLMARDAHWQALSPKPGFNGWTDDFASIVPVLRPIWGPKAP